MQKRGLSEAPLRAAIFKLTAGHPLLTDMAAALWGLGQTVARPLTLAELDLAPSADNRAENRPEQWLFGRILDRLEVVLRQAAQTGTLLRYFDQSSLNALLPATLAPLTEASFRRLVAQVFWEKRPGGGKVVGGTIYATDLALKQTPKLVAPFTESTRVV